MHAVQVGAILNDPQERADLRRAISGIGALRFYAGHSELGAAIAASEVSTAVVECPLTDGRSPSAMIAALRKGFPTIPIIAYCDPRRVPSSELLAIGRAGASELMLRGIDDVRAVLPGLVRRSEQHALKDVVLARTRDLLDPSVRPVIAKGLELAHEPLTVASLAHALGVHRRTLVYRLTSARLPPPQHVLAWCRLFAAIRMLAVPDLSAERVALMLEFPSGSALRNLLRRYTGLRPSQARHATALDDALLLFRGSILRHRVSAASPVGSRMSGVLGTVARPRARLRA